MEIHDSARRHGIADEDIEHAYEHSLAWIELDDEVSRYLLAGPKRAGNILELVVLDLPEGPLIIHAMTLRNTTETELFGEQPDD